MPKFSFDLPFFVPLQDSSYTLNLGGHEVFVETEIVRQDSFDSG